MKRNLNNDSKPYLKFESYVSLRNSKISQNESNFTNSQIYSIKRSRIKLKIERLLISILKPYLYRLRTFILAEAFTRIESIREELQNHIDPDVEKNGNQVEIVLIGAGGHARSCLEIIIENDFKIVCAIVAEDSEDELDGVPILKGDTHLTDFYNHGVRKAFVAVGSNIVRDQISNHLVNLGYELVTVLSKKATISNNVHIGPGTLVMPNAVINGHSQIARGCIINTGAIIEHDCRIEQSSHVAPGAILGGCVSVGKRAMVGLGARVLPEIKLGNDTFVGAGAVVTKDVREGSKVAGVPAKEL